VLIWGCLLDALSVSGIKSGVYVGRAIKGEGVRPGGVAILLSSSKPGGSSAHGVLPAAAGRVITCGCVVGCGLEVALSHHGHPATDVYDPPVQLSGHAGEGRSSSGEVRDDTTGPPGDLCAADVLAGVAGLSSGAECACGVVPGTGGNGMEVSLRGKEGGRGNCAYGSKCGDLEHFPDVYWPSIKLN